MKLTGVMKMKLITYNRPAKKCSYGGIRSLSSIKYIVIHFTAGTKDTAKNECDYFATGNTRSAGAHYFVDRKGNIGYSVRLKRIGWSVGGDQRSGRKGEAKFFGICTNSNSVSIELCAIASREPSAAQIEATKRLINHLCKKCKNIKGIIRHWDVNGKPCPSRMSGLNNAEWISFYNQITEDKRKLFPKLQYKRK